MVRTRRNERCRNGPTSFKAFTFNRPISACFLKASGSLVIGNPNAVAGHRPEIEAQLRQSSLTVLERTDLSGGDYRDVKGIGFEACVRACEADGRCAAFTFDNRHKLCWLKSTVPQQVKTRRAISGVKEFSQQLASVDGARQRLQSEGPLCQYIALTEWRKECDCRPTFSLRSRCSEPVAGVASPGNWGRKIRLSETASRARRTLAWATMSGAC